MDYIDVKYINLISSRLLKFKRVKPHLYNFRCPICGDSKKHKNKARGYFYQVKNNTNFKCHNCGVNISFNNFLKQIDAPTHKEYAFEKFKDGHTGKNFVSSTPEEVFQNLKESKPKFKKKVKIDLPSAFDVVESQNYLYSRAILSGDFYYAQKFKEFVNTIKPGFFDDLRFDDSRIIIPLVKDSELIGIQGRSLGPSSVKYITVMLNDDAPKIYGLDKIDEQKPIFIVEGPFDSTFLENSIAMCGSDVDIRAYSWSNYIWVFDNEPRNREIINRISNTIDRGEKVVIWPSNIHEKDINDMVLAGHHVMDIVQSNTYSGLEANLNFTTWKKT
tara:strand:+ start:194 stop:1186 length:993 start_codon:yes stop_codon:yes gene_type:complete